MTTITFAGTVDNGGTLQLDPGDTIVVGDGTTPDATLTGDGTVELVDSTAIEPFTAGSTLTNEDNFIGGGGVAGTPAVIDVALVNQLAGEIGAVGNGGVDQIELILNGDVTNRGVLAAVDGGTLVLNGITVDNTDTGQIAAGAGSQVALDNATVQGGSLFTLGGAIVVADSVLQGTADVGPILVEASVEVVSGHSLTLAGIVVNFGDFELDPDATVTVDDSEPVTLAGGGLIGLSTGGVIEGASAAARLENIDNAIVAFDGDVASGVGGNTISVDLLNIEAGDVGAQGDGAGHGLLTLSGATTNLGLLFAYDGGKLMIDGPLQNLFEVVADAGTVAINGDTSGPAGQFILTGGGELDIAATVDGIVTFVGDGGVVHVAQSDDFVGVWAGAAGSFDLEDVPTPPSPDAYILDYDVNASGTGGVLSLSDGTSELWSVELAGQYDVSDFSVGDDGNGGTLVTGGTVMTTSWQSPVSGAWGNASGWDAGVPGAWSQAELGSGSYTVTSQSDQTVYGISIGFGATLRVKAGSFWANGGSGTGVNAGTVSVGAGASFNISGNFENFHLLGANGPHATLGLYAAHVDGGGIIRLQGSAALEAGVFASVVSDAAIFGRTRVSGSTMVHATLGGSLTLLGGQLTSGIVTADAAGGGSASSSIAFGDVVVQAVSLTGGGVFSTIADTNSFFQGVTVAAGTTVEVASDSILTLARLLTNEGIIDLGDAGGAAELALFRDTTLAGAGELHLNAGTIDGVNTVATRLLNESTIIGNGEVGGGGMRFVNSGLIAAAGGGLGIDTGAFTVINGGTMTGGAGSTLGIASTLQNEGQLNTAGVGGALTLAAVVNSGDIDNALTGTISASGALTNQSTGTITNHSEYDQHSTVTNLGQIRNVEGDFTIDGAFSNVGSIQVDDGKLEIDGRTTNQGTITAEAGSEIVHGDSLVNSKSGTVTTEGTYTVNADLTNRNLIDSMGGTFTVSGNITNYGSIKVEDGASFAAGGRLTNSGGSLTVDDGTMFVQSGASGGKASLLNGGTLEFGAKSTVDVSFDVNDNLLLLDDSPDFLGDLQTFTTGNTVAFMDMASSDSINFNYTGNASNTGGVLKVVDSTAHLTALIHIVGANYTTSDFLASSYISPADSSSHFALVSQHPLS